MAGLGRGRGWTIGAALALCASARADEGVQKVLDCMRANLPPTLRVERIELENTDRNGGSRLLRGRLYAMRERKGGGEGLVRASLRIEAPDYLAGASYLVREAPPGAEDEMYVFLPSVNRVRRVIGDAGYDSLLGTNFSYVDFKQLESAFGGAPAVLEASQAVEQRPAWVLAFKAQPGATSGYSAIRAWIDQRSCVAVKVDFLQGAAVRKELTVPAAALKQSGGWWYPARATMRDLHDNTSTELRVLGVDSSDELPSRLFDPRLFQLGK